MCRSTRPVTLAPLDARPKSAAEEERRASKAKFGASIAQLVDTMAALDDDDTVDIDTQHPCDDGATTPRGKPTRLAPLPRERIDDTAQIVHRLHQKARATDDDTPARVSLDDLLRLRAVAADARTTAHGAVPSAITALRCR